MRFHQLALLALVSSLAIPWSAGAAPPPDECPTWFPDFSCDRAARFGDFIPPMTFPYLFEDPFITTEARAWAIWHEFPKNSVMDGGDYRVAALQVRLAVTDRLALIATKDGLIRSSPDEKVLGTEYGWADLGFGAKYALYVDPENRVIVTPSLRYQMTQGSRNVFQGNGDGLWIPAVSVGLGLGEGHVIGTFGAELPVDGDAQSELVFYNAQFGWPLTERLVPFVSINGITYVDDGDGSTKIETKLGSISIDDALTALDAAPVDGVDVANLGTNGTKGADYFTWAVGFSYALTEKVSLGVAYSRPLSQARREITQQRVALALTLGF